MSYAKLKHYLAPYIVHESKHNLSLCGFPGVCLSEALEICQNTSLERCSSCGPLRGNIFVASVSIMAFFILVGNGLVIASLHFTVKDRRSRLAYTKCSLAVADLMNGIQILAVTIPNYSWTMKASGGELRELQVLLRGSRRAIMGGFFFTLIYTLSLYHLLLISVQRFVAIKWPIFYKISGTRRTFCAIVAVWLLSILVAFVPAWLPECFVYSYIVSTFLFAPAFTSQFKLKSIGKAALTLCFVAPYVAMSGLTFATGWIVWRALKRSRKLSTDSRMRTSHLQRQYDVIKTLICMEVGFTVTLLPNAMVGILYYYEVLNCDNVSLPMLISFYISTSNSLVNVIVYSSRDENFQQAMKKLFSECVNRNLTHNSAISTIKRSDRRNSQIVCRSGSQKKSAPATSDSANETVLSIVNFTQSTDL